MVKQETQMVPNRFVLFCKSLYYDPFRWNLVKSFGMLCLGIRIARECKGMEVMPAITQ